MDGIFCVLCFSFQCGWYILGFYSSRFVDEIVNGVFCAARFGVDGIFWGFILLVSVWMVYLGFYAAHFVGEIVYHMQSEFKGCFPSRPCWTYINHSVRHSRHSTLNCQPWPVTGNEC